MGRLARVSVALATGASVTACSLGADDTPEPVAKASGQPKKKCAVSAKLVPTCGAWFGVTPVTGNGLDPLTAVHAFERKIGRRVDIYHGYHQGSQLFPSPAEI